MERLPTDIITMVMEHLKKSDHYFLSIVSRHFYSFITPYMKTLAILDAHVHTPFVRANGDKWVREKSLQELYYLKTLQKQNHVTGNTKYTFIYKFSTLYVYYTRSMMFYKKILFLPQYIPGYTKKARIKIKKIVASIYRNIVYIITNKKEVFLTFWKKEILCNKINECTLMKNICDISCLFQFSVDAIKKENDWIFNELGVNINKQIYNIPFYHIIYANFGTMCSIGVQLSKLSMYRNVLIGLCTNGKLYSLSIRQEKQEINFLCENVLELPFFIDIAYTHNKLYLLCNKGNIYALHDETRIPSDNVAMYKIEGIQNALKLFYNVNLLLFLSTDGSFYEVSDLQSKISVHKILLQ
jgi:hypothetical protein